MTLQANITKGSIANARYDWRVPLGWPIIGCSDCADITVQIPRNKTEMMGRIDLTIVNKDTGKSYQKFKELPISELHRGEH